MADPARKRARYEDLEVLPAHVVGEIVGGELRVSPRPAPKHAAAASRLGRILGSAFDFDGGEPGGWWILDEPEVHLLHGEEIVVPDLAGWRIERMPELPETAHFDLAPDWICEVLSPSTAATDRADKMPVYAAAAVDHLWLVDPALELLEVYRRDERHWKLLAAHRGASRARAEPFEAIALDLAALWRTRAP